jgi:peptidoglycan/xylan/chitin deacetylase (PgdA/CDA1 family)
MPAKTIKKVIVVLLVVSIACGILYILCYSFGQYSNKTFIITYHKIEEYRGGLRGLCVRQEIFDKQMKYLHSKGFRTIPLKKLIELLKTKSKIPKKVFVITFDDGYENNYTRAFPILKKYDFTATVFLNAGTIGKFYGYPRSPFKDKHLSAEQIAEMSAYLDFGSHSLTHPELTELSSDEIFKELRSSKDIIEKITGKPVDTFCYPFGDYDKSVVDTVKKMYAGACTTNPGLINNNTDPYTLPRFNFKEIKAMSLKDFFKSFSFYLKIL